jgi:hypothetical protein
MHFENFSGCFQYNVDFKGRDFQSSTLASEQACQDLCSKTSDCLYFTYNESNKNCWLKHLIPTAKLGMISGTRYGIGLYFWTPDI